MYHPECRLQQSHSAREHGSAPVTLSHHAAKLSRGATCQLSDCQLSVARQAAKQVKNEQENSTKMAESGKITGQ
jgi:hypothetical protein